LENIMQSFCLFVCLCTW